MEVPGKSTVLMYAFKKKWGLLPQYRTYYQAKLVIMGKFEILLELDVLFQRQKRLHQLHLLSSNKELFHH